MSEFVDSDHTTDGSVACWISEESNGDCEAFICGLFALSVESIERGCESGSS